MSKIKDLLYPPFSEVDAFSLLIAILIPFLIPDNVDKLNIFVKEADLSPGFVIIIIIAFLVWAFLVVKSVTTKVPLTEEEKYKLANNFYLIIGLLTISAVIEYYLKPVPYLYTFTLFEIVNILIMSLLLFRSIISIAALRATEEYKHILISQVSDSFANLPEIVLIFIVSIGVYFLLLTDFSVLPSILLTYFYTSTLVRFLKKVPIVSNLSS